MEVFISLSASSTLANTPPTRLARIACLVILTSLPLRTGTHTKSHSLLPLLALSLLSLSHSLFLSRSGSFGAASFEKSRACGVFVFSFFSSDKSLITDGWVILMALPSPCCDGKKICLSDFCFSFSFSLKLVVRLQVIFPALFQRKVTCHTDSESVLVFWFEQLCFTLIIMTFAVSWLIININNPPRIHGHWRFIAALQPRSSLSSP